MSRLPALLIAMMLLVWPAAAHEVRPAYLELTETTPAQFTVIWKQPVMDGKKLRLTPVFPDGCEAGEETASGIGATLVRRWPLACDLKSGEIRIDGLDRTLTDAFVRISRLDGEDQSAVLRSGASVMDLSSPTGAPTLTYFRIGVDHIWFGFDHLLFVLGLVLLVRPRQLLTTITAFTIAHSITLAASALAGVSLPGQPVEILIAMSIALLGAEAIYRQQGRETLSQTYPWAIAFGFGLIHGFGFAGALQEIGLPKGAEILALLLFNLGVEAGQIAFVAALLGLAWVARKLPLPHPALIRASAYAIGITGSFWAIERISAAFF